eukprot:551261_1
MPTEYTITVSNTKLTTNPSKNPTINPTMINIPSKNPTRNPSKIPSPTMSPQKTPTISPTLIPTTLEPTKPNYYVVGDLTDGPSKQNVNIYAQQKQTTTYSVFNILYANWIYVAVGGGGIFCCFILVCIRCCRRKKVAPPAVYNPPGKKRRVKHPQDKFVIVKSSSRATNIDWEKEEFIPPPPNGSEPNISVPIAYSLSIIEMKEGFGNADIALPGTIGGNIVRHHKNTNENDNMEIGGNIIRHHKNTNGNDNMEIDDSSNGSNDIENKQLIEQEDDMSVHVTV